MGVQRETVYTLELRHELTGNDSLDLTSSLPHRSLAEADRVLLSLRHTSSLDAGGLALLVRLHSQLAVRGKKLELVDVASAATQVLQRIGLIGLLMPVGSPAVVQSASAPAWAGAK